MKWSGRVHSPPSEWILTAGIVLLAAWLPLLRYPDLTGGAIIPFIFCFLIAGFAYLWALRRLRYEMPSQQLIWGFAIIFRAVLLLTPVTLSDDVYRYIWDGHLLVSGINPYAQPVESPLLDGYATLLRERVNYAWMATPYLPFAQAYFALVESLAPQNPWAFQVGAALLDLAAGRVILCLLRGFHIPEKAVLIYLWNPLVMVEFAHGAHVDVLMLLLFLLAVWGIFQQEGWKKTLSAVALAASVLVKGWPILVVPFFLRKWGVWRTALFGLSVFLPLAFFASTAGWGISGAADGRGVFGALRIYAATWNFNGGLFLWVERWLGSTAARMLSVFLPGLAAVILAWINWQDDTKRNKVIEIVDQSAPSILFTRQMMLPLGLYLLLAPTIHPWYLTMPLALLPFFWPQDGESGEMWRWSYPWLYFMVLELFTYLSYSGVEAPSELGLIQTAGYIPLWLWIIWAVLPRDIRKKLDLSRIFSII